MRLLPPFRLLVATWVIGAVAAGTQTASIGSTEPTYDQDALNTQQDPLQMGAMPEGDKGMQVSLRHLQEKVHLMKRMSRKSGKWGTSHPRHRLLETLFGYTQYHERNTAELNRWRSLYKSVDKKQKKASQMQ